MTLAENIGPAVPVALRALDCPFPFTWIIACTLAVVALGSGAAAAQQPEQHPTAADDGANDAAGVAALMARFAQLPGLEAQFREEKRIALLAVPLVNEGTIHYAAPGHLRRTTERPERSTVLLDRQRLVLTRDSHREEIEVGSNPAVRFFVDTFVLLLAGDRIALGSMYHMRFHSLAADGAWQLTLRPRDPRMAGLVREIVVHGDGVVLRELIMLEASGDQSRTVFTDVNPARTYTAAERAQLFPSARR